MRKIAFIGGGSFGFIRSLVKDLLSFPALADSSIALMDIDAHRVENSRQAVERIIREGRSPARVTATTDRAAALDGADGVVTTILVGGVQVFRHDVEIPKQHGVDINCGDTRGVAGIIRALRTIPALLEVCRDMERLCPKAILLNYTNPMGMLCRAMQGASRLRLAGLCHSVQHVAAFLARWIGADIADIAYTCAGINHQAWFLDYRWKGADAYPLIREAVTRPEIYLEEPVMNELFLHLGYYVTESSGHNSEYNPWFRKRPDLIEQYCTHGTGYNPGKYRFCVDAYLGMGERYEQEIKDWLADPAPLDLSRGVEFAAPIFNAVLGDGTPFLFNGNLRNDGLIDNLLPGGCVEVPIAASRAGLQPTHVGALPPQLAAINEANLRSEELAVEGALEGDARKIFHAVCYDPLTSAVLGLSEIKAMVNQLLAANRDWLPEGLRAVP